MYSGRGLSKAAASRCSRSVPSKPKPTPTWSIEPLADRQPAFGTDAAAQQDPRRAVGARGEHDVLGAHLAAAGRDADRAVAGEQHAVDERVGADGQVSRPRAASR